MVGYGGRILKCINTRDETLVETRAILISSHLISHQFIVIRHSSCQRFHFHFHLLLTVAVTDWYSSVLPLLLFEVWFIIAILLCVVRCSFVYDQCSMFKDPFSVEYVYLFDSGSMTWNNCDVPAHGYSNFHKNWKEGKERESWEFKRLVNREICLIRLSSGEILHKNLLFV